MKNKSSLVFCILIFVLPNLVHAQINFGIHANYGISNFIEKNNEPTIEVGNYYKALPSYSVGADALYSFDQSKFGIISGINISSFASENNMPDYFSTPNYTDPRKWEERLYSLSLPLKINYKFEEWIHINTGLSNNLILNKPEEIFYNKVNRYTLSFTGGFDFIIKQRIKIGASYYRDILPTILFRDASTSDIYDIKYSVEQITIKIGFILTN